MHEKLFTTTPMGKAILRMFSRLNKQAEILHPDSGPGSVRVYVFGGAAMHLYTNARGSGDVDAEIHGSQKLQPSDIVVSYNDKKGDEQILVWDTTFNPTLGPLHEDYEQNALPLIHNKDDVLWVYVVSPIDLAISKLGRWAENDMEDIKYLAEKGLLNQSEFEVRATDAIDYAVGNKSTLHGNLKAALRLIQEANHGKCEE